MTSDTCEASHCEELKLCRRTGWHFTCVTVIVSAVTHAIILIYLSSNCEHFINIFMSFQPNAESWLYPGWFLFVTSVEHHFELKSIFCPFIVGGQIILKLIVIKLNHLKTNHLKTYCLLNLNLIALYGPLNRKVTYAIILIYLSVNCEHFINILMPLQPNAESWLYHCWFPFCH